MTSAMHSTLCQFMFGLLLFNFANHAFGRFGLIKSMGQLTTKKDESAGVDRRQKGLVEYTTTTMPGQTTPLLSDVDIDKKVTTTDGTNKTDEKVMAAGAAGGDKDITWLYVLVVVAFLILLILLLICLCLLLAKPKKHYKPKMKSAETSVVEGGIAKAVFVDEQGKVSSAAATPKTTPSVKSFQL